MRCQQNLIHSVTHLFSRGTCFSIDLVDYATRRVIVSVGCFVLSIAHYRLKRGYDDLTLLDRSSHERQGAESPAAKCRRNFGIVLTLSFNMSSVSHYAIVKPFQRFYQCLS